MRANRYVSYLATEIEPSAMSTLSTFERATEKAFERIAQFNQRGAARITGLNVAPVDPRVRQSVTATSTALTQVRADAARAAPAIAAVTARTNAMSTSLFRSAQALNVVQGPLGPLAGRLSSLGYIFRDLAGFSLAGVLSGGSAFALAHVASDYQNVLNRLRPFYDTQQQVNGAMSDVIRIAHDTRQALDPIADLYSRINQAGKALGLGDQAPRITETVAKAARLSGGTNESQQAGLGQFGQAFGSNNFGGDELKSIRENTFRLAKAIADGLGVPIAKLKQLGTDGKLTSDVIAQALARSADLIDAEFSKLPKTIGSSLTEASNNLSIFIGRMDTAVGATQGFANFISAAANNIPTLLAGVVGLGTAFAVRNLAGPVTQATAAVRGFVAAQVNRASVAQVALEQAKNEVAAQERVVLAYEEKRQAILAATGAGETSASPLIARAKAEEQAQLNVVNALRAKQAAMIAQKAPAVSGGTVPAVPVGGVAGMKLNVATGNEALARGNVRAIQAQIDKLREKSSVEKAAAISARAAAQQEVAAAAVRVDAARAGVQIIEGVYAEQTAAAEAQANARLAIASREVQQLTALRAEADARFATARTAVTAARTDPNLSRGDSARVAATAAKQMELANLEAAAADDRLTAAIARETAALAELNAARIALYNGQGATVAQAVQLTTATDALNAALAQQAAAETALAAAEGQVAAANAAGAAAGIQSLSLAEQRIVAEGGLAAAIEARAAAEVAANAAGSAPGFKALSVAEQRIAAETRLARIQQIRGNIERAATDATGIGRGMQALTLAQNRILAEVALTGATNGRVIAEKAYAAAISFTVRAQEVALAAGSKLMAFLGGPLGVALTIATVGYTLLASSTDHAAEAADRFKAKQDELQAKLDQTGSHFDAATLKIRAYRAELARSNLETAHTERQKVAGQLGETLQNVSLAMAPNSADKQRIDYYRAQLRAGNLNPDQFLPELQQIRDRNPNAFQSNKVLGMFGSDPGKAGEYVTGYRQTLSEIHDARQAVTDATKPLPAPPPILGGGVRRQTVAELKAYAQDVAEGGSAIAQARAKFRDTTAALDAKVAALHKAGDFSFDQEYVRQYAAAQTELNKVGDAQRGAAAGAREHRAALAALRKESAAETAQMKAARSRGEALSAIDAKYNDQPTGADQAAAAKRSIDSFFTEIVNTGSGAQVVVHDTVDILDAATGQVTKFTRAMAAAREQKIDAATLKPATDAVRDSQRQLEIQRLMLAGRSDEAELLQQKYQLSDQIGTLEGATLATFNAQIETLRRQREEQNGITDAIAQRQKMIDIQARTYGELRDAVRDIIAAPLDQKFSTLKDVGKRLMDAFRQQIADKLVLELFGDPEQKFRDEMTRGLNSSADKMTSAAGLHAQAATDLSAAAQALKESTPAGAVVGSPAATAPVALATATTKLADAVGGDAPKLGVDPSLFNDASTTLSGALQDGFDDVVVTARVPKLETDIDSLLKMDTGVTGGKRSTDPANMSIEQRWNEAAGGFAAKIFGPQSPITRAVGKLGTFMSGAGIGLQTNSVMGALGLGGQGNGAKIGSAIGGGLGKAILGGTGGLLSKGLSAISSKLGSFAGPLGAIAGSVLGSLLGGLFDKPKSGTASVTGQGSGGVQTTGSNSALAADAGSLGSGIQSGLQKISDALGGKVGGYSVAIGTFDGKYRVNTDATTSSLNYNNFSESTLKNFGDDKEGAVRYAILNALQDGAIQGIREGTKRLLAAGTDLDEALNKALSFENVFRELKSYTDPVGAAIDDLNRQFVQLIDTFNQAGATSEEFADLQKLYDYKRADAIKNATNGAIDSLDSFIKNLQGGSDSPLSRQTVYANAKKEVDSYRADLAAGKTVDTDKLLTALSNYQDASQELNGSRADFYTDFNDILALAEKAKSNQVIATNAGGTLPASPFDPATTTAIQQTAANTADLGTIMQNGFQDMIAALQAAGYGGGGGSSLDFLPSLLHQS